ncbi:hypothetical protein BFP70_08605 [Thioclava sp. SK-1]|uniref:hypothetical protein n=1 Tax=Thioclava sp. SK-1 TaxID=1889770 RepID=UPI000856B398|nr:hypothetical protein [Thioclava sp. SK-1]OCX66150.1 hypothetical protein BFP70_08605 [Thioclava sp. SK-1]
MEANCPGCCEAPGSFFVVKFEASVDYHAQQIAMEIRIALKPLIWNGHVYTLHIRRHWNAFFAYAPFYEILAPRIDKVLPQGAGYHIQGLYELVDGARDYFDNFDNFWSYSCSLCDQYCDFYVMERPREGNTFAEFHSTYINDRTAVQDFAKASRGYVGPDEWKLT